MVIRWQRSHSEDIVAEVRANSDGQWWSSTWRRTLPATVLCAKTSRRSRQAACALADALARKTFDHTCDVTACGDWQRQESCLG
jgi:hypothetical protein